MHHIIPFRLTFDNSQKNLVPLCVKHHKEIEMMFVDTERFGMDKVTKFIWLVMIKGMQQVTATRIKAMLSEQGKNATQTEGLAHG